MFNTVTVTISFFSILLGHEGGPCLRLFYLRLRAASACFLLLSRSGSTVGCGSLLLRAATGLLALDGNDALLAESSTAADRIAGALHDDRMRQAFDGAGPVALVRKLAGGSTFPR